MNVDCLGCGNSFVTDEVELFRFRFPADRYCSFCRNAQEARETQRKVDRLFQRAGLPPEYRECRLDTFERRPGTGDALAVARLAGIMGAKRTPDLVPLCHPIGLHGVKVDLTLTDTSIEITATTKTADRTGVEMEALTSVAVAGLTMIDMIKAVDPAASIEAVRVLRKEGGKTGEWVRPQDRP